MYNIIVEELRADRLTPAELAFVGDAVHTLYVRERALCRGAACGTLHTVTARSVNARAQAAVFDAIVAMGALTAEEADIARRAKNAHLHSRAKAASPDDYHKATALEAVIGYVHLQGNIERERALLQMCEQLQK